LIALCYYAGSRHGRRTVNRFPRMRLDCFDHRCTFCPYSSSRPSHKISHPISEFTGSNQYCGEEPRRASHDLLSSRFIMLHYIRRRRSWQATLLGSACQLGDRTSWIRFLGVYPWNLYFKTSIGYHLAVPARHSFWFHLGFTHSPPDAMLSFFSSQFSIIEFTGESTLLSFFSSANVLL
jgi:hypothetical protein